MTFLESCRLLISTLSPVHIGCGEDYDPTNYVIDNNTLYEFNPSTVMTVLKAQDREQLLKIVSGNANDRMLQDIQQFFYQRRQSLIPTAMRRVPVGSALAAFYQKRVGQTVQVEGDNSRLVNKLEIERAFFNPINGEPILPGSSLKGSVRTALLDGINNGKPLQGAEKSLVLQQRLFRYDRFEQDPMRLVQLLSLIHI